MRHFTIIQAKNPISKEDIERLKNSLTEQLPFGDAKVASFFWESPSGRTLFLYWSNDPFDDCDENDLYYRDTDTVVAHVGWMWDSGLNSLHAVGRKIATSGDDNYISGLSGAFAVCRIHNEDICIWNSIAGQPEMFYGSNGRYSVISSRGLHVASLLHDSGAVEYSRFGMASFIAMEYFYTDTIGYADVERLAPYSVLKVCDGQFKIRKVDAEFDQFAENQHKATSADFDDLAQSLLDSLEYFKQKHTTIRLSLTGGKDSRVVLAAVNAAGLDYYAETLGWESHADMIAAGLLCKKLGVKHNKRIAPPYGATTRVDILHPLAQSIWQMDAMHYNRPAHPSNLYDECFSSTKTAFSFCGTGGEIAKGVAAGFDRGIDQDTDQIQLAKFAFERASAQLKGNRQFIREPYRTMCREWSEQWIEENYNPAKPLAILERIQLFINQIKRVSSAINLSAKSGGEIDLLLDNRFLRLANRLRTRDRADNHIHFEVMSRLAPELINLPLADARWCFEMKGPRLKDDSGYKARTPILSKGNPDEMNYTYMHVGTELKELFQRELFSSESKASPHGHFINEIIDMDSLEQTFKRPDIFQPQFYNLAWNVLAAKTMVSNHWLGRDIPKDNVLMRYDVPYHAVYFKLIKRLEESVELATACGQDESPFHVFTLAIKEKVKPIKSLFSSSTTTFEDFASELHIPLSGDGLSLQDILDDGLLKNNVLKEPDSKAESTEALELIATTVKNHLGIAS